MTQQDFPAEEFESRLERAQRAMHAQGIDAMLFTTEAEIRYFTGFRTLFWQSPTRPWFLVVPIKGKPVAVIPEIGAALMRATWIDDVRTWSSPAEQDDGVSLLTACLTGVNRLGIPMGRESTLRIPLQDFDTLRQALPNAALVDVSPLMQALRFVKSPAEVEKIAAICGIASDSFENAHALFSTGQPLNDAFRAFKTDLLNNGAEDVPYLVGGAGPGGYADVISPPTADPIREGDVLMLDTGSTLQGYFCDFDRNYAFGHAAEDALQAYRTLYAATDAALTAARPGARCCDLFNAMARVIGQTSADVGRFGHGLGLQLTEGPSLISFDRTQLEIGAVITLEPSMEIAPGRIMVHEENILITDGPPRLLSRRAPPELPIIQ